MISWSKGIRELIAAPGKCGVNCVSGRFVWCASPVGPSPIGRAWSGQPEGVRGREVASFNVAGVSGAGPPLQEASP